MVGLGKRKIEMTRIENPKRRHVCFSKRRKGLFKKGAELQQLSHSNIAIIVFSEAGRLYTFGDVNAVTKEFLSDNPSPPSGSTTTGGTIDPNLFSSLSCHDDPTTALDFMTAAIHGCDFDGHQGKKMHGGDREQFLPSLSESMGHHQATLLVSHGDPVTLQMITTEGCDSGFMRDDHDYCFDDQELLFLSPPNGFADDPPPPLVSDGDKAVTLPSQSTLGSSFTESDEIHRVVDAWMKMMDGVELDQELFPSSRNDSVVGAAPPFFLFSDTTTLPGDQLMDDGGSDHLDSFTMTDHGESDSGLISAATPDSMADDGLCFDYDELLLSLNAFGDAPSLFSPDGDRVAALPSESMPSECPNYYSSSGLVRDGDIDSVDDDDELTALLSHPMDAPVLGF